MKARVQRFSISYRTASYNQTTTEVVFLVQESQGGGFEARALTTSIYTEADTLDELKKMIRDAVSCHFSKDERPKLVRLHFEREEMIAA